MAGSYTQKANYHDNTMPNIISFFRPLPKSRERRLTAHIEASLGLLPLTRHPAFAWTLRQEGYRNYVFGAKAGPVASVSSVIHDMAHAVEFGPEAFEARCSEHGFVFNCRQVEVLGELYPEPLTSQATERECRTFAIQYQLLRLMGRKEQLAPFCQRNAPSLDFLSDGWRMDAAARARLIEAAVGTFSDVQVLQRLEGWLDLTRERLRQPRAPVKDRRAVLA